jgi:CubicO group peptidase (beta-lactamase class C family)
MRMHLFVIAGLVSCSAACSGSPAGETGDSTAGESTASPTDTGADTSTGDTGEPDATTGPAPTDTGDSSESSSSSSDDTGDSSDTGDEFIYPEPDWLPGEPEEHGFSGDGLASMAAVAEESDSHCLVVTQGGVLIGEWYWEDNGPDVDQDNVYSVTKSVTSALVGIAVERGELDIEAPVGFPEWAGTDSEEISLRNLISNDSGREWSFDTDYVQLGLAPDQTGYALGLGHAEPIGTWWEYNNAAIQTVERALVGATGNSVASYAQEHLFNKIHMTAAMDQDDAGNTLTYQGVSASCRDLARFGYLYLRGGRWAGGVQVVPESWVSASTTPSTPLNDAYGFMWWLNRDGHWILPSTPLRDEGDGKLVPDAPDEMFAAMGAFGQLVVVDPTTETVWVRLGPTDLGDAAGIAKMKDLWAAFAAAQVP